MPPDNNRFLFLCTITSVIDITMTTAINTKEMVTAIPNVCGFVLSSRRNNEIKQHPVIQKSKHKLLFKYRIM